MALTALPCASADVLPSSGTSDSLVALADGQFVLNEDADYTNVHFYALDGSGVNSLVFDGQGLYALNMVKDEHDTTVSKPLPNERRNLIWMRQFANDDDLTVAFRHLTGLRLDGTGQTDVTLNGAGVNLFGLGDTLISIEHVTGDVYLGGFNDASALSSQSSHHAGIHISDIDGRLSVVDNSAINMSNYAAGLLAWSHQTGGNSTIVLSDIRGGIDVSRNRQSYGFMGIAVCSQYGDAVIEITNISGGILMEGNEGICGPLNTVAELRSVIVMEGVTGDIVLRDNHADFYGGAMYAQTAETAPTGEVVMRIVNVDGNVLFENNDADYYAGAIMFNLDEYGQGGELTIADIRGDVVFRGNSAGDAGGAIFSMGNAVAGGDQSLIDLTLSADGGNMIFEQNTAGGTANGILAVGRHHMALRAAQGRVLAFYDPVLLEDGFNSVVEINREAGGRAYGGMVVFSGEQVDASDAANLESVIDADAALYGGKLSVEHKAVLDARSMTQHAGELALSHEGQMRTGQDFIQHGGMLSLTGGSTLAAGRDLNAAGTVVLGSGSAISSGGNMAVNDLVLDLGNAGAVASMTAAGSLRVDGSITLLSSSGELSGEQVLRVEAASLEGRLANPDTLESRVVSDSGLEQNIQVTWGSAVDGGPGMQTLALYATTTTVGIAPSLYGSHVVDSMLSSASNAQTFADAAMDHLNPARFAMKKDTMLWAQGLGDFSSHRSRGGLDGYDYDGGGYSVGIDRRLGSELIAGIAYGQLFGKSKSRDYYSSIKQQSIMGMIYGAWHRQLAERHALTVAASVTYGNTDNDLTTPQWDGKRSTGDWHHDTFVYQLRATWHVAMSDGYTLTPFAGLEYTDSTQDAFTERGDRARRFDKGHYRNLAAAIGAGIGKTWTLGNGMLWSHGIELSYVPDLYRHNADADAELSGYRWQAKGVKPARNAVRAAYQTRLALSDSWALYGGYALEGRSDAAWHQVNLGASYSF